jgi:Secretion system C-terminal sorting domain
MKKLYILFILVILGVSTNRGSAQCNFTKPGVELIGTPFTDPVTGKCMIKIDLYFDLQSNDGGKYVYVHIWQTSNYPSLSYGEPPHAAELINSVATIGFYHHGGSLYMLNSYTHDPTIPNFQYNNILIFKGPGELAGYDKFEVENLILANPLNCTIPQSFTADVWESQSAQGQVVHCFSKELTFFANDPKIISLLFCNVPRTYKFDVSTINSAGMSFDYKVFIDNGDRIFNTLQDTLQIGAGNNIVLNAANSFKYNSPVLQYEPYSYTKPYADKSLWVVITSASLSNQVYGRIDNLCITLPVMLKNFTAVRNYNTVNLQWTTETEINNKGFYIERKNTNGDWMILGFVTSVAPGGNSTEGIIYTFTDINTEKTNTLYRLRQMDLNAKVSMSETRMVAGKENDGRVIVYPNPTNNGELNLVFAKGETLSDIKLVDMNGQVLRQWNNFSGTTIYVNNISPGIYNLNVITRQTKEQFNIKVAIK